MTIKNVPEIDSLLDSVLPDERIQSDIAAILWGADSDGRVELEEGSIRIPPGTELAITTKAYFKEYFDLNFGPFKVQVAIGGVDKIENGIQYAKYCFATIYYNEEPQSFSIDFYKDMR